MREGVRERSLKPLQLLDYTMHYECVGQGFESLKAHQKNPSKCVEISTL